MSERKVINKYIPSNYNPDVGLPSSRKGRGHVVRVMAPYSMKCLTCSEYIYKGKKFNARKETVWEEDYLGVKIFRFYVRCPMCSAEITYKTDPKNRDYAAEHGATRNFEPWREEAKSAEEQKKLRIQEEEGDPMKALENKTFDSKREIDIMDALDDVRLLNAAHEEVDLDLLLQNISSKRTPEELETEAKLKRDREEDDEIIKQVFAKEKEKEKEKERIKIQKKPMDIKSESAVGKSSLVLRFVRGRFMENQESTIGASFLTQSLTLKKDPNVLIKFEIWDTAGQERYHSLAPMYYRGAHAAIVVYDMTSKPSFERAKGWVDELRAHTPHNQKRVVALVGNKADLLSPTEELAQLTSRSAIVSKEDAEQFASDNGLIFYETSAKSGANVQELFESIGNWNLANHSRTSSQKRNDQSRHA